MTMLCEMPVQAKKTKKAMKDRHAATPTRQRGAQAVEFALVLPFFLVLLMLTVDLGFLMLNKAVITNASREGARAGIVARNPAIAENELLTAVQTVVENYTKSALVNFGASNQPRVTIENGKLGVSSTPTLKVSVFYKFDGIGLGGLSKVLGTSWDISASTVMVYE